MSDLDSSASWPDDFCGSVKLFPLPNLVLFPHVVQPLHIFEPRYCEMLQDALASDSMLGMALLQPGWESNYLERPRLAETVCVGKILSHTPTDDGRHNILLVGLRRGRIIEEIEDDLPYRSARIKVTEDSYPLDGDQSRPARMHRLQQLFSHFVPEGLAAQESFKQLVGKQLPLGILTDTISFALNLPLTVKQQLLAEDNVDIRCRLLIRCLESQIRDESGASPESSDDGFPPKFSDN
ncbi:MAG: LON peptidase substrate-binding domain-containing protein [Aureliella sp.]